MGIAIHIVLEVQQENGEWQAITDDTWAPRDWKLFTAITFGDDGGGDNIPYPPRGLPEDHSIGVRNSYFFPVGDGVRILNSKTGYSEFVTSPAKIEKMLEDELEKKIYKKYRLVPGEWTDDTSWLTLEELETAMNYGGVKEEELSAEFRKLFSKMRRAAKASGEDKVRMVFWFSP
jgi:hypothetical protein